MPIYPLYCQLHSVCVCVCVCVRVRVCVRVKVRTNHERLVRLSSEEEKDYPLMLQTTSQWQDKGLPPSLPLSLYLSVLF